MQWKGQRQLVTKVYSQAPLAPPPPNSPCCEGGEPVTKERNAVILAQFKHLQKLPLEVLNVIAVLCKSECPKCFAGIILQSPLQHPCKAGGRGLRLRENERGSIQGGGKIQIGIFETDTGSLGESLHHWRQPRLQQLLPVSRGQLPSTPAHACSVP